MLRVNGFYFRNFLRPTRRQSEQNCPPVHRMLLRQHLEPFLSPVVPPNQDAMLLDQERVRSLAAQLSMSPSTTELSLGRTTLLAVE
jgi:hypothetical protein